MPPVITTKPPSTIGSRTAPKETKTQQITTTQPPYTIFYLIFNRPYYKFIQPATTTIRILPIPPVVTTPQWTPPIMTPSQWTPPRIPPTRTSISAFRTDPTLPPPIKTSVFNPTSPPEIHNPFPETHNPMRVPTTTPKDITGALQCFILSPLSQNCTKGSTARKKANFILIQLLLLVILIS